MIRSHQDLLFKPGLLWKNLALHLRAGRTQRRHLFIVGAPRSGTTLLQNILLQHDDVTGPSQETAFFLRRRLDNLQLTGVSAAAWRQSVAESRSKAELFDSLAQIYINKAGRGTFLEKTADHALKLDRILTSFPNSKVIFVIRDGRDCLVSARRFVGIESGTLDRYPMIWRDCMRSLIRHADNENLLPVRYETFCTNSDAVLEKILDHAELAPQAGLLDPASYSRTDTSANVNFARLRQSVTSDTVGVHREECYAQAVAWFESVAWRELSRFGYPLASSTTADRAG